MHAGSRRIGNNHIRTAVLCHKVVIENILHVSCEEERVLNSINSRIDLRVFNRFRHIFNADYLFGFPRYEISDGSCARI